MRQVMDKFTLELTSYEMGVLKLAIKNEKETIRKTRSMSDPVIRQLAALTGIEERIEAEARRLAEIDRHG